MLKKDDAEREILTIWLKQKDKCSKDSAYPLRFYNFLKINHFDLLDFKHRAGDTYQIVQGWINKWQDIYCK